MKVSCILAAFFVLESVEALRVPSIQTQLRAGIHNRISPLRVPSAHVNIHMSEKDQKQKLPFFLDINTKGGIIFYSIIGIVLPFIAYSFMVDVLDLGVVLAGNVILVLYVGLGIVVWTGRCGEAGSKFRHSQHRTSLLAAT